MKLVVVFVILLFVITFGAMGYYFYSLRQKTAVTPALFQNPFTTQPTTSFSATTASTPAQVNPFASPTPTTYQNPFSSGTTASEPYKNPFEKLR